MIESKLEKFYKFKMINQLKNLHSDEIENFSNSKFCDSIKPRVQIFHEKYNC